MATTIVIPEIDYETYNALCEELFDKVGYAILNDKYLSKKKIATIQFHDSRYIPNELKPFMIAPPAPEPFDMSKFELIYAELDEGDDDDMDSVQSISLKDEFRSNHVKATVDLKSNISVGRE